MIVKGWCLHACIFTAVLCLPQCWGRCEHLSYVDGGSPGYPMIYNQSMQGLGSVFLPEDDYRVWVNATVIDLSYNAISNVQDGDFTPCQELRYLNLSNNVITSFHQRNLYLIELNLANNHIASAVWPDVKFTGSENTIETLILSGNTNLSNPFTSWTADICNLYLSDTQVSILGHPSGSGTLFYLEVLDITWAALLSLGHSSQLIANCKMLKLDGNDIGSSLVYNYGNFDGMRSLAILGLSDVGLDEFPGEQLVTINETVLELDLSWNHITQLLRPDLKYLKLTYLDLSWNPLKSAPEFYWIRDTIEVMLLSHINLTQVPVGWKHLSRLTAVDLSHNPITTYADFRTANRQIEELDTSGIEYDSLDEMLLQGFVNLKHWRTTFRGQSITNIVALSSLKRIEFIDSSIESINGSAIFDQLPQVELFLLENTKVGCFSHVSIEHQVDIYHIGLH